MITRNNVQCDICQTIITLRISISSNIEQHHTFSCPNCRTELQYKHKFRIPGDETTITTNLVNCHAYGSNELHHVINLHPDSLIPKDKINDGIFSINIHMIQLISDTLGEDNVSGVVDSDALLESWNTLKIEWDLVDNNRLQILHKRYVEQELLEEGESSLDLFNERLFQFLHFIQIHPDDQSFYDGLQQAIEETTQRDRRKLSKLIDYYKQGYYQNQMTLYKKALTIFFDGYADFRQIRLALKLNLNTAEFVMTNFNFNLTEKVYAELFEIISKAIGGLGLFLRVYNRQDFDGFQNITLTQFHSSSVQNKITGINGLGGQNYIPNPDLVNNDLRNASSHRDMRLIPSEQKIEISHRGQNQEILYMNYLEYYWLQIDYISKIAINDMKIYELRKNIFEINQQNPFARKPT